MIKHKPVFEDRVVNGVNQIVYVKNELDDNFLFYKTMSISINADAMGQATHVEIHIVHRDVTLFADTKDIERYADVREYHGEYKYYLPVGEWKVISGDHGWVSKLRKRAA